MEDNRRPSITAFFPCYNDGGTIGSMVTLAAQTLESITDDYEIIVIDDGRTDHSREILQGLARHFQRLRLVFHENNRGYGGALRSGFYNASKDLIFYTDGDAQYDVLELPMLFAEMRDGVDLVNGYKIGRSDPWYRIVLGRAYHWIAKVAFGLKLRDVDCDFRLMRRAIFDRIELECNSGVICVEFIKKVQDAGFVISEVPVHHFHRTYGRSQFFNVRRVGRVGLGLARLWWKLVVWPRLARKPRATPIRSKPVIH
ncbi:MAG: glycosyltransferase family 2 protein [Dehalococcoidia bacterium]|nr:glycosyltransferase family 2 protein [Dehalococcoidia bacterium]